MRTLLAHFYSTHLSRFYFPQEFYTHQGEWFHTFSEQLPEVVSRDLLEKRNKEFGITEVKEWVERNGSMQGRFKFFETYAANSEFYQKVAKPLLSMRTVGSIDVERRVKGLKHTILTKKRNKLQDPKGVALMRASENLRHIMKAKKVLGKKITDYLCYTAHRVWYEKIIYLNSSILVNVEIT